jgi:hypothetical protein
MHWKLLDKMRNEMVRGNIPSGKQEREVLDRDHARGQRHRVWNCCSAALAVAILGKPIPSGKDWRN